MPKLIGKTVKTKTKKKCLQYRYYSTFTNIFSSCSELFSKMQLHEQQKNTFNLKTKL